MDGLITALSTSDSVIGIFAAVFLYLYVAEKKAHTATQTERIADLKVSMESVHKSVTLLDGAITEIRHGGKP